MKTVRVATFFAAVALVLSAALPAAALAASGRDHVEQAACVISLFVVDPGSDEVRPNGEEFAIMNSGQMTEGSIDCFDRSTREPIPELSGAFATSHGSAISWDSETGAFEGGLSGGFSLVNMHGEAHEGVLQGLVVGTAMVVPPGFIDGFPEAQVVPMSEFVKGTLKLEIGNSRFNAGFEIGLVGVGFGLGELAGSAKGILRSPNG